eukprot:3689800-Rhodomonas_salina.2
MAVMPHVNHEFGWISLLPGWPKVYARSPKSNAVSAPGMRLRALDFAVNVAAAHVRTAERAGRKPIETKPLLAEGRARER